MPTNSHPVDTKSPHSDSDTSTTTAAHPHRHTASSSSISFTVASTHAQPLLVAPVPSQSIQDLAMNPITDFTRDHPSARLQEQRTRSVVALDSFEYAGSHYPRSRSTSSTTAADDQLRSNSVSRPSTAATAAALLAASSILDSPSTSPLASSPLSNFPPTNSSANTTVFQRPCSSSSRPTIEIPQPQSPITLHHALDGSFPSASTSASSLTHPPYSKMMTRTLIDAADTLARDHSSHPSHTHSISSYMGQKRIMTPTSRLAETAVGVREVSKKIGRARVKLETPKTVMIVTKPGDESLLKITREIAFWMISVRRFTVFVDEKLKDTPKFKYPSFLKKAKLGLDYTKSLKFWTSDLCAQEAHLFDFAITLGGDGTVLFTSWLFQRIVPPILPFSAGSLGFLTPFATGGYQQVLDTILDHGVRVNLRMRFSCTIYRCLEQRAVDKSKKKKRKGARHGSKRGSLKPGQVAMVDDSDDDSDDENRTLPTVLTTPTETFEILNDLVLDRGPSANLSLLELFGDEQHLTTVQADGIVISTPTGSTAYSLAAGGPLTHPEIPAILISPICPHTLSFRPMLLPDSMELRICVPFDSRSTAWASFDGRGRVELKQGDHIKVTASVFPFPTICSSTQSSDWFHSLSRCLRWNERERQKGFRVVEHSRPRRMRQPSSTSFSPTTKPGSPPVDMTSQSAAQANVLAGMDSNGVRDGHHASSQNEYSSGSTTSSTAHSARNESPNLESVQFGMASEISINSSSRTRQPGMRSGQPSLAIRRASPQHEYFDHSPQDTDTMLTCWGTDSSGTEEDDDDDDDDSDSDRAEEKDDADDGDGEWEEGSSSEEDDDDYEERSCRSPKDLSIGNGTIPGHLIIPELDQVASTGQQLQRELASPLDEARAPTGRDIPELAGRFNGIHLDRRIM
ncbi:hypothetical protein BG004_001344 [Podila humilis]|nr:hypothetical protein BG004_001344 [Podila humilis]